MAPLVEIVINHEFVTVYCTSQRGLFVVIRLLKNKVFLLHLPYALSPALLA